MSDKPFDPVTDGTPEEFSAYYWRMLETPDEEIGLDLLTAARDIAMRRKGMLEAAEFVHKAVEAEYLATLATGRECLGPLLDLVESDIRTAAEKISDPLQVEERCNGKEGK